MKRQYLLTERAHFMCPNMHFGMLMEIETEYIEERDFGQNVRSASFLEIVDCL